MSKPIIALDMDGVIADWCSGMMNYLPLFGINSIDALNEMPHRDKYIDEAYRMKPTLFENLPLIECAEGLIDYLNNGVCENRFDLVVATHTVRGMENLDHETVRRHKISWINKNIKPRWPNLIKYDGQVMAFTGEGVDTKSMIAKDNVLLIDDYHRNITEFSKMGGHGVLVEGGNYRAKFVIDQIELFLIKNKAQ